MYAYLKGSLASASPSTIILDVGGVGFQVHIPLNLFAKLPPLGGHLLLYTTFIVREEVQQLYGFLLQEDKALFEQLLAVSGVGPKTALALMGHLEGADLAHAIQEKNIIRLCAVPGIGKKTAERLVVDLRDSIKKKFGARPQGTTPAPMEDALSALMNLGYAQLSAHKALTEALEGRQDTPPLAELITAALRLIR